MGGNVCAWNENKQEGNINKQERKRKQTKAVPVKSLRLYILLRISWRIRFKSHRFVTRITLRSRRPRCRMGRETKTLSLSSLKISTRDFPKKKKRNQPRIFGRFVSNQREEGKAFPRIRVPCYYKSDKISQWWKFPSIHQYPPMYLLKDPRGGRETRNRISIGRG